MNEGSFSKDNREGPPAAAGRPRRKRVFWVVVGAFVALFVLVAGFISLRAFDVWRGEKSLDLLNESFKRAAEEKYERQMADTYGGKTPQETLQMYIEAVEAGDYELASRYFVEEGREKELRSFGNTSSEDVRNYLVPLKEALQKGTGEYSLDKKYFSFDGSVLIALVFYPNGIWKIEEI